MKEREMGMLVSGKENSYREIGHFPRGKRNSPADFSTHAESPDSRLARSRPTK